MHLSPKKTGESAFQVYSLQAFPSTHLGLYLGKSFPEKQWRVNKIQKLGVASMHFVDLSCAWVWMKLPENSKELSKAAMFVNMCLCVCYVCMNSTWVNQLNVRIENMWFGFYLSCSIMKRHYKIQFISKSQQMWIMKSWTQKPPFKTPQPYQAHTHHFCFQKKRTVCI